MKRRWFGVALALWAVVAPLVALVSAPVAYADNEQFTFDTGYANGVVYYFIRGINGAFKSGAELRAVVGSANIGSLPAGKVVPNTYSTSAALGALDGGCGQIQITNVNPSGTAGVFTATLQNSGNLCAIPQGAIKVYDPNNALGTGSADAPVAGGTGGTNGDDPPPDCDAGPATFMVCDFISKPLLGGIDWIRDTIIVPFLREKPLDKSDKDVAPVYKIWASLRNVASIFFILVFFLVIFGTAIGWDNYTVKKILPRLVAGAILVPFSWYICVIIVDVGNVLGQGLVSLISPLIPTSTIDFSSPISKIFLGTALLGIGAIAIASISAGVIVSIAIGFLAVFFTLVMRKILIILFIVLSPLAVLAWILPNTSKWFKEWWENFFKLVMMYPIIMLLFEAGRLFAATAGATFGNGLADKGIAPLIQVVGLTLPLFAVPFAAGIAGKGLQTAGRGVGKVMNAADRQFGKGSSLMEGLQNNAAARAADHSKGNKLSRGIWRLGSGTASPLPSAGRRAEMQARAEKHIGLMSHDQGHKKAVHDILNKADQLEDGGDKKAADALRASVSTAGRIAYGTDLQAAAVAKAAGDIQGHNKAKNESIPKAAADADQQGRDAAERAKQSRAKADAAEASGDALTASILRKDAETADAEAADKHALAGRIRESNTTIGQMTYDASKAKSNFINGKMEVASYTHGKAAVTAAAADANTKAIAAEQKAATMKAAAATAAAYGAPAAASMKAQADKAQAEAVELRAAARSIGLATSDSGKMIAGVEQGRDKMITDKAAIRSHLNSSVAVEQTAKNAEDRAGKATVRSAEETAKAAAATRHATLLRTQAADAKARGDDAAFDRHTAEADEADAQAATHNAAFQKSESEARLATAEALNLRRSLTTDGKLDYQTEMGTRRIVGEKTQMASLGVARSEIENTAQQAEAKAASATADAFSASQRAQQLRSSLGTVAGYGAPAAAAALKAEADKAEARAVELTATANTETTRAANLRENLTISGRAAMQMSQEKQNVIVEQNKLEGLRQANEKSAHDTALQLETGSTLEAKRILQQRAQETKQERITIRDKNGNIEADGRIGNIDLKSKSVVKHLQEEAKQAMRIGDEGRAEGILESLTRSSSGKQALREIQYSDEFGGGDSDTIKVEYKDLWDRAVGEREGGKATDLRLPRTAAFTGVSRPEFQTQDKWTKVAYLDWVKDTKDPTRGQYLVEAANNVIEAAGPRYRGNLDDETVVNMFEETDFMSDPRAIAALQAADDRDQTNNLEYLYTRYNGIATARGKTPLTIPTGTRIKARTP